MDYIEKLLGDRKPVLELEIDGERYPIYAYERLSVSDTLRVSLASIEYALTLEANQREYAEVAKETQYWLDKGEKFKVSALMAQSMALEARLLEPQRKLVEAFASMPEGALSDLPARVVNELFSELCAKVFSKEEGKGSSSRRKDESARYAKAIADALPLLARHGYRRREALALEHWEFWDFVRAVKKEENYYFVRQLNVNSMPDMEEAARHRMLDQLLEVEKEEDDQPWTLSFGSFLQSKT